MKLSSHCQPLLILLLALSSASNFLADAQKVHSYVCTGTADSKFGLDPTALTRVVNLLTSADCPVRVEGLHCHLGSTIKDTGVFRSVFVPRIFSHCSFCVLTFSSVRERERERDG